MVSLTRRKLIGNVTWLYALQGLNYVIPLAVLPYLVRVLGIERYGLLAFAQAFAQYFVMLSDYGFNLSATKHIAQVRENREEVSRIFWAVIFVKVSLMIIGAMVLVVIVATIPRFRPNAVIYAIAYVAVLGNVLFPMWLFQGMERMRYISVVTGGAKLLSAVLLFVFIHQSSDYALALTIQSGGMLVAGVAGFWIGLRDFEIAYCQPSWSEMLEVLRDGWHLFISTAAISLYTNTNVFLVGTLAGNVEAGYFSVAEKLTRAMSGLISPVSQAIFPHVSALALQSAASAHRFLSDSLKYVAVFSGGASVILFALAQPVTLILFGRLAEGGVPIVRWIALLPFLIGVSNVLGIQTMIPFGLERQFSRILIFAGLLNVAMAIPMIHWFAAKGAAVSVLVTEAAVVLGMFLVLEQQGIHLFRLESTAA